MRRVRGDLEDVAPHCQGGMAYDGMGLQGGGRGWYLQLSPCEQQAFFINYEKLYSTTLSKQLRGESPSWGGPGAFYM